MVRMGGVLRCPDVLEDKVTREDTKRRNLEDEGVGTIFMRDPIFIVRVVEGTSHMKRMTTES
jgi:hypothetical protein